MSIREHIHLQLHYAIWLFLCYYRIFFNSNGISYLSCFNSVLIIILQIFLHVYLYSLDEI
jgi:hypothetical protein